ARLERPADHHGPPAVPRAGDLLFFTGLVRHADRVVLAPRLAHELDRLGADVLQVQPHVEANALRVGVGLGRIRRGSRFPCPPQLHRGPQTVDRLAPDERRTRPVRPRCDRERDLARREFAGPRAAVGLFRPGLRDLGEYLGRRAPVADAGTVRAGLQAVLVVA